MININIRDVSKLWNAFGAPDDIVIEFTDADSSCEVQCSLQELILLYDRITSGNEDDLYIGIGSSITIEFPAPDKVELCFHNAELEAGRTDLVMNLEDVLYSIFEQKDTTDDADVRDYSFNQMEGWLEARGVETNPKELYDAIMDARSP